MSQCKAVTSNGVQCKNSAKEDSEYCGIHDSVLDLAEEQNRYKLLIYSIGAKEVPNMGILAVSDVEDRLQSWYNKGYELFEVSRFDRVAPSGDSIEHFWVMFVLKRK